MREHLDRRVLPDPLIDLIRRIQEQEPCHLAGGAALAGAYLGHRLSRDIDLFVHDAEAHRRACRSLSGLVEATGGSVVVVQDAPSFFRAHVRLERHELEFDLVHEPIEDLEQPGPPIDGIVVESLTDLRVRKLRCLLSRSEPRDLVDVLCLERAGHRPEVDLNDALRVDGGMDPSVLAWLLRSFPVSPMPVMLIELSESELAAYRDELAARFRALAVPPT